MPVLQSLTVLQARKRAPTSANVCSQPQHCHPTHPYDATPMLQGTKDRRCALVHVEANLASAEQMRYSDLRVAVAGGVDAGKSTMVAVLSHGSAGRPLLDNGRGRARMNVLRHKHEIETGRTSSISQQVLGYDAEGRVLNYQQGVSALTPAEMCAAAAQVGALGCRWAWLGRGAFAAVEHGWRLARTSRCRSTATSILHAACCVEYASVAPAPILHRASCQPHLSCSILLHPAPSCSILPHPAPTNDVPSCLTPPLVPVPACPTHPCLASPNPINPNPTTTTTTTTITQHPTTHPSPPPPQVVTFIDMGGHEKYLKTALYSLTSMLPDYLLLCVCAQKGIGKVGGQATMVSANSH